MTHSAVLQRPVGARSASRTAGARGSAARTWTIAQRELKALFDHPTGYVLLIVFIVANAFLFFRQAYLTGVASVRPMLELLPWLFLFFVPAVTMRTLAEDSRSGVIEVVLTQPVTDWELVFGKYIGAVLFLWIALAATVFVPIGLRLGANIAWGVVIAQYVGAGLLAAGLSGVGVWASSLARSQITAFILGVAVMFVFIFLGLDPLVVGLPPTLGAIAARLGVLSHFENIARGVIDLRDAIYFLSLAGVFLALAYGALVGRRLARGGAASRRLRIGVSLLVATLIVVNLLGGYIGGRLDLTPGHAYTLSGATKRIVGNLDDIVTIKVFASDELPTSAALLKGEIDDLLRDLRSAGHGKIRIVRLNPKDETVQHEAQTLGIEPVQFNVIGQSELQVKQGYLGIAIQYGTGTETIPFVNRTDDLEYRLVAAIRSLTLAKKPVIGWMATGPQSGGSVDGLRAQVAKDYEVRAIPPTDSAPFAPDISTLVVVGSGDSLSASQLQRLETFFHRGGSALVLADGMTLTPQLPMASPHPIGWNAVLKQFGVTVRSDMVYDLMANEVIPVRASGGVQVLERYPYFIQAQSTGESVVHQDVSGVLDTTAAPRWAITPLLVTSRGSGASTAETQIMPDRDYPQTNLAPRIMAVQVAAKVPGDSAARGRVVVVGDVPFATDEFTQHSPGNMDFVLNAIDWLAQDESLIAIRSKERTPPALAFSGAGMREGVKYFNVVVIPILVAVWGLAHLARRRRAARMPFRRAGAQPATV
jgi:ABC-type uncharacterized transport system involved in gliding motility auxiliary subunit